MYKRINFFCSNSAEVLKKEFLALISKKKSEGILVSDVLITEDIMYAEYLQAGLLDSATKIASNIDIFSVKGFINDLYAKLLPEYSTNEFSAQALQWHIFNYLNEVATKDRLSKDSSILEFSKNSKTRLAFSINLAKIFAELQIYRASWLLFWQNGDYSITNYVGNKKDIDEDYKYLAILWQYLYKKIKSENANAMTLYEMQALLLVNLQNKDFSQTNLLPNKVIMAGVNNLPISYLDIFLELGNHLELSILMDNPSPTFWTQEKNFKYFAKQVLAENAANNFADNNFIDYFENGNKLLLYWVRGKAEFFNILDARGVDIASGEFKSVSNSSCLLNQIQNQLFEFVSDSQAISEKTAYKAEDKSLKFNICHTPMREIEVLHDAILKDLSDYKLQPRDILVIVSDIATYSPVIKRVFERKVDNFQIPYYINDLYIKDSFSLVKNFIEVLEIFKHQRFYSSELVKLLNFPAITKKFAIDDMDGLKTFVQQSNIRCGLEASEDDENAIPISEKNTWLQGVNRMLLGFVTQANWQSIDPLESSYGKQSSKAGGLYLFIITLIDYNKAFKAKNTYKQWYLLMQNFIEALYEPIDSEDFIAITFLQNSLAKWQEACESGSLMELEFDFHDFLISWLDMLNLEKSRQHYYGNFVHFGKFTEGRNITYKKIYIVGMNDKSFPHAKYDKDKFGDIFYTYPHLGDRSRKVEDTNLFLQTILAAKDNLTISWIGKSEVDDSELSPSSLIAQLRDYIQLIWDKSTLESITQYHPLHGFDKNYFLNNQKSELYTYNNEYLDIYRKSAKILFNDINLVANNKDFKIDKIKLSSLAKYLKSPIEQFYKDYLQIQPKFNLNTELKNTETFEFDRLENWKFNNELINEFDFYIEKIKKPLGVSEENYLSIADFIDEKITTLIAKGEFFNAEISRLYLVKQSSNMVKVFNNYMQLKSKYCKNLYLSARQYTYKVDSVELEFELPNIYKIRDNQFAILFVTSKNYPKTNSGLHSIFGIILQHLALTYFSDKIFGKEISIFAYLCSKNGNYTLPVLNKDKAEQLLKHVIRFYPTPLVTDSENGVSICLNILNNKKLDKNNILKGIDSSLAKGFGNYAYLRLFFENAEQIFDNYKFIDTSKKLYLPLAEIYKEIKFLNSI